MLVPGLMIVQLLFEALVLGLLVRWVAPHNATGDLFNTVIVIGGALLGGLLIEGLFNAEIGLWTLPLHVLLLGVLLIKFCGTNPVQTVLIVVIFYAVRIAVRLGLAALVNALTSRGT